VRANSLIGIIIILLFTFQNFLIFIRFLYYISTMVALIIFFRAFSDNDERSEIGHHDFTFAGPTAWNTFSPPLSVSLFS